MVEPLRRSDDRGRLEVLAAKLNAENEASGGVVRWEVGEDVLGTPWRYALYPRRLPRDAG